MQENPYSSPASNLGGRDSYGSQAGVSHGIIGQLARTKGWTRFIGILAILVAAMVLIVVAVSFDSFRQLALQFGIPASMLSNVGVVVGAIAFLFGGVFLTIGLLLNSFSTSVSRLIRSGRTRDLNDALNRQRQLWLLCGLVGIVKVAFGLLVTISWLG